MTARSSDLRQLFERVWYARTPATGSPVRLTGIGRCRRTRRRARFERGGRRSIPAGGRRRRRRRSAGAKKGRSDATTARWSRSSTCARYSSVAAIGNATSIVPWSSTRVTLKPTASKTSSIALFVRHHLGHEALDANLCRARRELLQKPCADASPLMGVGDRERGFGGPWISQPCVVGQGNDRARPRPNRVCRSGSLSRPSPGRGTAGRAPAEASWRRGSGSRGSRRRDRRGTRRGRPRRQREAVSAGAFLRRGE